MIKTKNPILSFCIPTYNRVYRLLECVNSIRELNFKNIEIIVSDNNSEDKTEEVIKKLALKDKRIKYFKNKKNVGLTKNVVEVLKRGKGEYVYLTSDEDIINKQFFINKFHLFKKKEYSLILGSIYNKNSHSFYVKEIDKCYKNNKKIKKMNNRIYRQYISGIIFKKKDINFSIMDKYVNNWSILYPHIFMILMCLSEGMLLTCKEIICFQGRPETISYVQYDFEYNPNHYTHPLSRLNEFKFWNKATKEIIKDEPLLKKLQSSLGVKAAETMFSSSFKKYKKELQYEYFKQICNIPELKKSFIKTYYYRKIIMEPIIMIAKKLNIFNLLIKLRNRFL
jgi:glycosyltransferase involved in cell wall biosynthesis